MSRRLDAAAIAPLRQSNQTSKRGKGTPDVLEGSIYIYNVFLSDTQSGWTLAQKRHVKQKLHQGFDFLSRQAMQHDKSLVFVEEYADDLPLRFPIPVDAHADPRWTEYCIAASANESGEKLVERIRSQTHVDNVIICLHVNKSALSYNLAYYDGVASDTRRSE